VREPATLAALAAVSAHRCHDLIAAVWRDPADGNNGWRATTWGELATTWRRGALGLEARGIGPGDRVGIAAMPGPESMALEHAVLATGAASVYGAEGRVVDSDTWQAAIRDGATIDPEQPDRFEKLVERITADSLATVTVTERGSVELTHDDLLWHARSLDRLVCIPSDDERDEHTIALLDLREPVGRLVAHYWPATIGATVWWPGPLDPVDALRDAQPTVLAAPAAVWSGVAQAGVAEANDRWLALGRLAAAGEHLGFLERVTHRALRRLFRTRLHRRRGLDRCVTPLAVGTLDRTTMRELAALGIGVGLTWSDDACGGLVTATAPRVVLDPSDVGLPVPGAAVRAGPNGLEVRPPGRAAWISTGVSGRLDAGGGVHLS
jgi:hypothetical protein